MRAMVLAAGRGARLRLLTDAVPKVMLRVGGKPVLAYALELLARHGVQEVAINLHHRPDRIVEYCQTGRRFGLHLHYWYEPELLGTAGAVRNVAQLFTETFLVLYGDNITDCDLTHLVSFHRAKQALATVALFEREEVSASGVADLGPDDRIHRFVEKPCPGEAFSHWVSAGILVLEPAVLDAIPPGVSDFGTDVLPALCNAGAPVYGYRMSTALHWIDTPEDHARLAALFSRAYDNGMELR